MRKKKSFFAPIICLPLLACGSSDNNNHSIIVPDAHTGSGSGAGSGSAAPCTAGSDYGAVTFGANQTEWGWSGSDIANNSDPDQEAFGDLNADTAPDILDVLLYAGYGVYANGPVKTGTYALTGDETDSNKCGACVQIFTDLDDQGQPTDIYFATGGSLTLTAVGSGSGSGSAQEQTGTLSGSVASLTLTHVTYDGSNNQQTVGDCTSAVTSASFSGTLTLPPANLAAQGPALHLLLHRHK